MLSYHKENVHYDKSHESEKKVEPHIFVKQEKFISCKCVIVPCHSCCSLYSHFKNTKPGAENQKKELDNAMKQTPSIKPTKMLFFTSQPPPQLSFGPQSQSMIDLVLWQFPIIPQVQHQQFPIRHEVSTIIVITLY